MARKSNRGNGAIAAVLGAVVLGMVGMAFASVPLYRVFCAATDFGGTTQRATAAPKQESAAVVTVRFDAETAPGLGWDFYPLQREVRVHLGERREIVFRAVNHTPQPVTARAVYNVTPTKVGIYFDKLQCFCFDEQTLKSGESKDMGVVFFVDPDLMHDRSTSEVRTITLSYTMFRAADQRAPTASAAAPIN